MARFKRGATQMSSKGARFSTFRNACDYSNTQYWIWAEKYIKPISNVTYTLDFGEKRRDSGHQYLHMSTKEKNIIFCCLWFKNQTNKDGKIEGKSL